MAEAYINKIVRIVKETDSLFFDIQMRNNVSKKGDFDFVTEADKNISTFLHKRLKEEFPGVGFMSEEEKSDIEKFDKYWILDPIDGTTNFMRNIPLCAISLALCENGIIKSGVIYIPYLNEIYYAERGRGAFLNGEKIKCSKADNLLDCLALYEFNAYFKNLSDEAMDYAKKLYTLCQDIRTFGSAAAQMAFVACGRADVFIGRSLKPWDYAAGIVIIEEAGGKVTAVDGDIDIKVLNRNIAATNKMVHKRFLNMLNN